MNISMRQKAVAEIAASTFVNVHEKTVDIEAMYGEYAFTLTKMKELLPKTTFKKLEATISKGDTLDIDVAEEVANVMRQWATAKGATHYTHWFQPLTGTTAEKQDSFITPDFKGKVTRSLSGKQLIQGEPDASSFPNGGIRQTSEARGYTAWDPTSPAFIKETPQGSVLYIPTAFFSYTGEALDKKTPLLRSIDAVSKQAKRVLACFGEDSEGQMSCSLGAEQEYFLLDKKLYMARPDMVATGRTLFGNTPAKNQQMDDHYFGAIKDRIIAFMEDVDMALWRLGIPSMTRHNEVAPSQFELAPMFESANLATDHNLLIMETLKKTAEKYGLVCLLHEKPYTGINGSGKHNNWSIVSPAGKNLLEPGKTPYENAIFLTTLCAVIMGVDEHAELLRAVVASAGNDHRLGANEAPPAIISIFLGDQLGKIVESIKTGKAAETKDMGLMKVGVDTLPTFPKDNTDRNRTSPFAFTGNKFEFRAVASHQSCSGPMVALNTIIAGALDEIATKMEKFKPETFNTELQALLQDIISKHDKVIFNGNGYADDWQVEAAKRGLPNLKTTPEALPAFISDKTKALFTKFGVLTERELESRFEIYTEQYDAEILIEGKTALDVAKTVILPSALEYLGVLNTQLVALKGAGISAGEKTLVASVEKIGSLIDELSCAIEGLTSAVECGCPSKVIPAMLAVRKPADALELEVADGYWPLPKYSELIFMY